MSGTEEEVVVEENQDEGKLDKEALEASKEPEVDPKDAVIGTFRKKARAAELEAAQLKGQLDALTKQKEPEIELSPLEQFVEDNPDEEFVPAKVQAAQVKWDRLQKAKAANTSKAETVQQRSQRLMNAAKRKYSVDKTGEGLDFDTVFAEGGPNISLAESQRLDQALIDGDDSVFEDLYELSIARTPSLQQRKTARSEKKVEKKPAIDETPSQEEIAVSSGDAHIDNLIS